MNELKRISLTVALSGAAMLSTVPAAAALPSGWQVVDGPAPSADRGPNAGRARVSTVVPTLGDPIVVALDELPRHAIVAPGPLPDGEGPRFFDGFGRPLERLDVAPRGGELYVVPPGGGGRILVGDRDTFWNNDEPFFNGPRERARGFGVHFPWNARIPAQLAIVWHAIEADDGGLRFRSVEGSFDRFVGKVEQSEWIDSPMRSLADGLVHAFVSDRDGTETVHVVVPTGDVAYASPHVVSVSEGGGFFGGRTPFTELRLPLTSLRSSAAGVDVSRFSMARFRAAGGPMEGHFDGRIHLSVSDGTLVVATTGSS